MRKFLVIAVLAGLSILFLMQKRTEPPKPRTTDKAVAQTSAAPSPRPLSEHNWMKRSLDRTNEVKRQVADQRKQDPAR
ncbi:MAG TPA: hypothetical protein VF511_11755 [Chthoniobacterales bacterium]